MNQKQFMDMISTMPPLPHSVEGKPFDIEDSETVKWVMELPGLKDWVWRKALGTGRLKFDPVTRKWVGVSKRPKSTPPENS